MEFIRTCVLSPGPVFAVVTGRATASRATSGDQALRHSSFLVIRPWDGVMRERVAVTHFRAIVKTAPQNRTPMTISHRMLGMSRCRRLCTVRFTRAKTMTPP